MCIYITYIKKIFSSPDSLPNEAIWIAAIYFIRDKHILNSLHEKSLRSMQRP